MKRDSVVAVVAALNEKQAEYLIVGGLAVVAHGYVRFTADVDLIVSIEPENLRRVVNALQGLGYRPRAPVDFHEFIDPSHRKQWAQEKNMTVFSLFSGAHPATEVDLFLEPPLDFSAAYGRALRQEVAPGTPAVFCSLEDLIALKSMAGRPEDQDDIAQLKQLRKQGKE
jgi:hypothetical protein